jgi:hypothetical protein
MASTNRTSSNDNNDALNILISMGFDISKARSALDIANGDLEYATNYLLNAGDTSGTTETTTGTQSVNAGLSQHEVTGFKQIIQGTTSQYSYENGRSACSFIALTAATTILNDTTNGIVINESLIDEAIQAGCNVYTEWRIRNQRNESIEHTSVEEILQSGYYSTLELLPGGIRQGMLSTDHNGPFSLHTLLSDCQSSTKWVCVVMIKPPETILLCLPPSSNRDNGDVSTNGFCLVDSHPRIQEFGAEHAYCRIHTSLNGLAQSVLAVFPMADLGPDVPEYMASMYNSFDLYPLRVASKNT